LSLERSPVQIPAEQLLAESISIVEAAKEKDVILRIMGGLAIYAHSAESEECKRLQLSLGRLGENKPPFTDLDLIGYNKQWKQIRDILEKGCGLKPDRMVNALFGDRRLVYFHPKSRFPIDVFFETLEFSHILRFGDYPGHARLQLDYPTLTLADIVLEKLQIHQINRKDLIDLMVLFLGHDVAQGTQLNAVDAKYIAGILADDWGFWYDATNNLSHLMNLGPSLVQENKLSPEQWETIGRKVNALTGAIEAEQKTPDWKIRAALGTSKPWYREVDDL
jgi:hypothetical protein